MVGSLHIASCHLKFRDGFILGKSIGICDLESLFACVCSLGGMGGGIMDYLNADVLSCIIHQP